MALNEISNTQAKEKGQQQKGEIGSNKRWKAQQQPPPVLTILLATVVFFLIPIVLEYWPLRSGDVKYKVSGLGLSSATVNHPAHILIELIGSNDKIITLNITTELELVSTDPPLSQSWETSLSVDMKSLSWYKVSYTPVRRGKHKLHVQINNEEIDGSPFTVTAYPDPYQLGKPVRTVTDISGPYSMALSNNQQMIVSKRGNHSVSIFDTEGQIIWTFGYYGDDPNQMKYPKGIAVDDKHLCDQSAQAAEIQ